MHKILKFCLFTFLLVALLIGQPVPDSHAQEKTVNVNAPETAETNKDVTIFVGVKQGSNPLAGVRVDVVIGGTSIGGCITDAQGSCKVGYRFDTPGTYTITALFEDKNDVTSIRIIQGATVTASPTGTAGPAPSGTVLTPLQGEPTMLLPTVNIPTSTPTHPYYTSTPRPATETSTPLPSKTPKEGVIIPTYDPGYTPTPAPPQQSTEPISQWLTFFAVVIAGGGLLVLVPRVLHYRRLKQLRDNKK